MRRFRHYRYPRRRTAYGPRDRRAAPRQYVHSTALHALSARELAALPDAEDMGLRFADLPMPNGGARIVVTCPMCQRRRAQLYYLNRFWPWVCRQCAGLVYWRQYEGRRPEAGDALGMPERALWAMRQGYRGWRAALDTWQERDASHDARAWVAITINTLHIEQMIAYHNRLDELNAALLRGESYHKVKRQSQHTATILKLERRIRRLEQRQRKAA